MRKLERLLNLTAVLLHTARPLTAGELREKVPGYPESDGAFHRAFERDKDDLRDLGIPIEIVAIPGTDPPADGYRISRTDYYLPDPGLDPDELAALQLAAAAVRLEDTSGPDTLWKLGGVSGDQVLAVRAALPTHPNLGTLFDAVSSRSPVRFTYRNQARTVHPYRIGFQLGHWYLRGYDLGREAPRVYRIDRISGAAEVDAPDAFEIPPDEQNAGGILPDRWELGDDPPKVARVRIDANHAPLAMGHFQPEHVVAHHDDGAIEVELTVTNREAFRTLVLSYLDHAEVLEPPELRDDVVAWLRATVGVADGGERPR